MKKHLKKVWSKFRSQKEAKPVNEEVHEEISGVRLELRNKFMRVQKAHLRDRIESQLASLKDEVNVEAILADLGEKYILRRDLNEVVLESDYNSDPVLLLRFTKEDYGKKEEVDRFVPLVQYSL